MSGEMAIVMGMLLGACICGAAGLALGETIGWVFITFYVFFVGGGIFGGFLGLRVAECFSKPSEKRLV